MTRRLLPRPIELWHPVILQLSSRHLPRVDLPGEDFLRAGKRAFSAVIADRVALARDRAADLRNTPMAEVMTRNPKSVRPGTLAAEAGRGSAGRLGEALQAYEALEELIWSSPLYRHPE